MDASPVQPECRPVLAVAVVFPNDALRQWEQLHEFSVEQSGDAEIDNSSIHVIRISCEISVQPQRVTVC